MELKSLVAVAAIATAGFASNVAVAEPLVLSPNAAFSHSVSAGFFTDTWTFNLGLPSTVASSLTNIEVSISSFLSNSISGFSANLNGAPLTFASASVTISPSTTITTQVLSGAGVYAAGAYTLTVSGTAGPLGASYGGNIVAIPVPEPESYAMLLAGLGLMGTIARRRSKASNS